MRCSLESAQPRQRGIILVTSLLLLIVVTLMALSIFRSFGIQEKIAGNMREKQRALQAAVSTENYAEWWIQNLSLAPAAVSNNTNSSAAKACTATVINANTAAGNVLICNNTMASLGITASAVPWSAGATYRPVGMNVSGLTTNTGVADVYYQSPGFYIYDVGAVTSSNGQNGELYQVDAFSYGLNGNTVAVVESTVQVVCSTVCSKQGL